MNDKANTRAEGYLHLLSFGQHAWLEDILGTELWYRFEGDKLLFKFTREGRESRGEADRNTFPGGTKECLSGFLLELLSDPTWFHGEPFYISSGIFTLEDFNSLQARADAIIDENISKALQSPGELIDICRRYDLNPCPAGNTGHSWYATCPSGRGHSMHVSTQSEQWGCGYCRRKGGKEELDQWITENRKPITDNRQA